MSQFCSQKLTCSTTLSFQFQVRIIQLASQTIQIRIKIVHLIYNQHGSFKQHKNKVDSSAVFDFKLSQTNLFWSLGESGLKLILTSSSFMQRIVCSVLPFCIFLMTSQINIYLNIYTNINDDVKSFSCSINFYSMNFKNFSISSFPLISLSLLCL